MPPAGQPRSQARRGESVFSFPHPADRAREAPLHPASWRDGAKASISGKEKCQYGKSGGESFYRRAIPQNGSDGALSPRVHPARSPKKTPDGRTFKEIQKFLGTRLMNPAHEIRFLKGVS